MERAPYPLYLDNAATSFPKPAAVAWALAEFVMRDAVNPGRTGTDRSIAVGRRIDALRADLARFLGHPGLDPNRVVFAANATDALNLAIGGVCRPGDHVVSTVTEHNSVLRPLHMLSERGGIEYDLAGCDERGAVSAEAIAGLLRPATRLVVLNHASNVVGTVQPVAEIGALCRGRGVLLLLDCAQTAGLLPIRMADWGVDLLAFTGHKSLLGPTGTGGLVVGPDVPISGTRWGGTGVLSQQREQPREFPFRLEAGTLNTTGLAGLAAALAWLRSADPRRVLEHEAGLARRFLAGCRTLPQVRLSGWPDAEDFDPRRRTPVFSLTLVGRSVEETGLFLDAEWNIAVRTGLHCAPRIHEALGTGTDGTVRISFGAFNTPAHVDRVLEALDALSARRP